MKILIFLFRFIFNRYTLGSIIILYIIFTIHRGGFFPKKIPFSKVEKKYNLKPNDLKAIMQKESNGKFMVININNTGLLGKVIKGTRSFTNELSAQYYLNAYLPVLQRNYDVGPMQINSYWFKTPASVNYMSPLELMSPFNALPIAAKILGDNYTRCIGKGFKGTNIDKCAFSMYNSGYDHTRSTLGRNYAKDVMNKRQKMTTTRFNEYVTCLPIFGYLKL